MMILEMKLSGEEFRESEASCCNIFALKGSLHMYVAELFPRRKMDMFSFFEAHPSSFQLPKFLSNLFCIVKVVNDHIKFAVKHNLCIENCSSQRQKSTCASPLSFPLNWPYSNICPSFQFQGYSLRLLFRFKMEFFCGVSEE